MTLSPTTAIGRVKTAMIFGASEQATAVVCTILARVHAVATSRRVSTSGVIKFDAALVDHVERHLMPVVDAIAQALVPSFEPPAIELSAVNVGAASLWDRGAQVSGFSADAPILLAILSAVLAAPVRQDIMASGHLSSDRGDIGAVRNLAEKLAAATFDPSVRIFVIPSLNSDRSMQALSPSEWERATGAVINAKRDFRVVQVAEIAQLVQEAYDDESVVMSSLNRGYFGPPARGHDVSTAMGCVVGFFSRDLECRFWRAVEEHLFAPDMERLHALLHARANHDLLHQRYPSGYGRKLRRMIRSLPPTLR